ncbi:hypothetical protein F442_12673 [Phytophthora nicotianae P10297]|uniref:MULE transposase domain-containing protein n=1 Tax=Phytophthora nicotianae P10297 TaxID=1317064 RepID=W2Z113_PHYNI|nr:hypothetical protein F442_12673 [Phytophthora nicotianae P10297]
MVGVTGMNTTIHLVQSFIRTEAGNDYTWALTKLKRVMDREEIWINPQQYVYQNGKRSLGVI